jgi:hypothetical protein
MKAVELVDADGPFLGPISPDQRVGIGCKAWHSSSIAFAVASLEPNR